MHTVLADKNKIFVFGSNSHGQLGLGNNENKNSPQLLTLEQEVSQIACGARHTIILEINNDVLVFGANFYGQLGLGHNKSQTKPQLLMHREKILQIACGAYHTIILKGNLVPEGQVGLEATLLSLNASKAYHDVLVFGGNEHGQLGLGHNKDTHTPQLLMRGEQIRQIACGAYHTIILKANCDVLVFGDNIYGQLGLGHNEDQNKPQLLSIKATLLSGIKIYPEWSPKRHFMFLPSLQKSIYTFLLVHKRSSLRTRVKIPKFVLFEIFKWCALN